MFTYVHQKSFEPFVDGEGFEMPLFAIKNENTDLSDPGGKPNDWDVAHPTNPSGTVFDRKRLTSETWKHTTDPD